MRLLLAGLIALGALLAGFLAAVLILFTGLVGFVIQLFRPKTSVNASGPGSASRAPAASGDVIDVVATQVPAEPPKLERER